MTMLPWQVPLSQEVVDIVTGSLLWAGIVAFGAFPGADSDAVNTELCLDVLARCEEHGLEPDPASVTRYVASLVAEVDPGGDPIKRAAELILFISEGA